VEEETQEREEEPTRDQGESGVVAAQCGCVLVMVGGGGGGGPGFNPAAISLYWPLIAHSFLV
jgi:hypothetical protein